MAADERSDVVVSRVLLRLLEIQDANLPGALGDSDVEFLHDFRVAIRRTRSVLREMRGVFAPDDLERVRASFKWLQDQTSATRDLDVYLEEFERAPSDGARHGPGRSRATRAVAQGAPSPRPHANEESLTSERARTLHSEWAEILRVLVLESEATAPDAPGRSASLRAGGSARCTARW